MVAIDIYSSSTVSLEDNAPGNVSDTDAKLLAYTTYHIIDSSREQRGNGMSANVIVVLIGWLIALAIFFGCIVLLRYLYHRERMALISQGFDPTNRQKRKRKQNRGILRAGLITGMVGLALTLGLYPVGFFLPTTFSAPFHLGPWLLPGLIPLGVGLALTASYYLEQSNLSADDESNEHEEENVVHFKRQNRQ